MKSATTPKSEVFNIDCMEGMKAFPDKYFELAIVDPPYGIGIDAALKKLEGTKQGKGCGKRTKFVNGAIFDHSIPKKEYFSELKRVSENQIMFGGNYFTDFLYPSKSWIVWQKNTNGHFADAELAWTSFDIPVRTFEFTWNGMLQGDMKNKENRFHPTQKPVALYRWLLQNYAKQGDKILDTHMGSQSSRIAAYQMGFDYTGYEIDKDYFDAGCKRFNLVTSQTQIMF